MYQTDKFSVKAFILNKEITYLLETFFFLLSQQYINYYKLLAIIFQSTESKKQTNVDTKICPETIISY